MEQAGGHGEQICRSKQRVSVQDRQKAQLQELGCKRQETSRVLGSRDPGRGRPSSQLSAHQDPWGEFGGKMQIPEPGAPRSGLRDSWVGFGNLSF